MIVRQALPLEAAALTKLAFLSKSHWPYPKELLEKYRPQLEVLVEDIVAGVVYVGIESNNIIGFYDLSSEPEKQRLYFLFVDPGHIGKGYGKQLWQHAIATATQKGWNSLSFFADSYAADSFYKYQNCKVIGSMDSILGKLLEMSLDLAPSKK